MRNSRSICWVLLVTLVSATGCSTLRRNPLEGWELSRSQDKNQLNNAIRDDYESYILKLSSEERKRVTETSFFENSRGERAVKISTILKGLWLQVQWEHVLIYNRENRRVRTVKYKSGRFLS